ncbi:MAG: MFS transporter [Chthoniobacterales bacterium]|nr:MFS transporter [Chthoniobacterales bacterium]
MAITPSKAHDELGLTEKIGYGAGDFASNLYFQFFNLFLFYYYTDVFGLAPVSVGTMYLIANFWNAVNDPMMGALADRVQTKQGKYRPFLLWCALPYGLLGYAIFANPDLGEVGKLAYAYTTFIAFKMIYTAINVPYSALMGVISPKEKDRMSLATYRFLGAFGGGFLISLLVRPLVKFFGGDDEVVGFQATMAVFGVLSIVFFLLTYVTTRERVAPQLNQNVSVMEDLRLLARNVPWIIMLAAAVCTLASVAVRGAVSIHYFKYYVGNSDKTVFSLGQAGSAFFLNFDVTTVFLSSGMLAFILGVSFSGVLGRLLGKRNALAILTLANGLAIIGFFFIPPEKTALMFGVNLLANLLAGPTPALVWALYTDVADYGEWKFGRRATGLVFSGAMFAQKMGLTIGGTISGWVLGLSGFVANEEQSPESLMGIRIMFCLIPGALALLNGVIIIFYPLNTAKTEEMHRQLQRMREEAA